MRRYVHQPCEGFCLIVAVVCLLLSPLASAETIHPNIDRGFKADKTYDVLGLDTINTFNGNINIRIPIGMTLANGGEMSYGFTLVYNSKVWDYREEYAQGTASCIPVEGWNLWVPNGGDLPHYYQKALPTRHANAGLGWNVGFGRLISPDSPLNDSNLRTPVITTHGCDPDHPEPGYDPKRCDHAAWGESTGAGISIDA